MANRIPNKKGLMPAWKPGQSGNLSGRPRTKPISDRYARTKDTMKKHKKLENDSPTIGEHLLTLREAANVLRLSTRTLREYVQRGEIEGRIIGRSWRFRPADLDAFYANAPRNWDFAGKNSHGD